MSLGANEGPALIETITSNTIIDPIMTGETAVIDPMIGLVR